MEVKLMKIFLDDIRDAPDDTWTVVRNIGEALEYILDATVSIEEISLDHDLGEENEPFNGYWLCNWFERQMAIGKDDESFEPHIFPERLSIHSANPVGRRNMQAAIDSIERMRTNG
jgi:hypothetical protein